MAPPRMSPSGITAWTRFSRFHATATEVHQEGVRIPPIKAYEQGEPNSAALDLFFANVRLPEEREGDFQAVIGSCKAAKVRLDEVFRKYGQETVEQSLEVLLNRAERRMRDAISSLTPGEYYYEHYVEGTTPSASFLPVRVRLVVGDGEITADFSGSAPQSSGPMNSGVPAAPTAAFIAIKACLDPYSAVNGGAFRPIRVITQDGTIFRSRYPAATSGGTNISLKAIGAVMGALARASPQGVVGDTAIASNHVYLAGWDPHRQREYIHYEFAVGGTGAVQEHDGSNVVAGFERGDFPRIYPTEVVEASFPLLVECSELLVDGEGHGRQRGGLGIRRRLRLMADSATLSCLLEPSVLKPCGMFGGDGGAPMACRVIRNGQEIQPGPVPGKALGFALQRGDVVEADTMGGGGYGDPLERDPELVAQDVLDGYITQEHARNNYGVTLRNGCVHPEATRALREELRRQRVHVTVVQAPADEFQEGCRVCRLSPKQAQQLGLQEGAAVEWVSKETAPLRAWVKIDTALPECSTLLGPLAQQSLGVQPGDVLWLRPLR